MALLWLCPAPAQTHGVMKVAWMLEQGMASAPWQPKAAGADHDLTGHHHAGIVH
jgi:hypothetical protein